MHLRLHRVDGGVALLLGGDLVGGAEVGFGDAEHGLLDLGHVRRLEVARLLGGALGELDDRVDHRLESAVPEHDGAEHHVLGKLMRLRFHHQHGVGGAGDDEVELRFLHLVGRSGSARSCR